MASPSSEKETSKDNMTTSSVSDSSILKNSIVGAVLNTAVAMALKVLTFVINAFVVRRVPSVILGIINVRLLLLVDTVLFISREAFRKACLKKPENGNWRGTINLVWMSVPIGLVFATFFGYWWIEKLELPPDPEHARQYAQAVIILCASVLVELSYEVFFVVGQIFMWVKFRSVADLVLLSLRAFSLAFIVILDPDR